MSYISRVETILTTTAGGLLAFLVGSFPTAYILVRRNSGKDVRREGSGNVGTLNAFEVTRSRSVGIMVLGIDLLKGALPVLLIFLLRGDVFLPASAALIGVVLGHNYSPWIGWKGGRGLAPAAGATLVFNPFLVAVWVLFWGAGYAKTRDVHFGNIAATLLTPLVVLLVPDLTRRMNLFSPERGADLPVVAVLLFALILLKHIEPLRQLFKRSGRATTRKNSTT